MSGSATPETGPVVEGDDRGGNTDHSPLTTIRETGSTDTVKILTAPPLPSNNKNDMGSLIPNNLAPGASHTVFLSNHIDSLLTPPTKVERILLNKSILYAGEDGKLYFTPRALRYYVSKAVIPAGTPEDLLRPGINPFGFHCIDGRVTFPEGFHQMSLPEQLKVYPGTIPGGGAGMLLTIISSLLEVYGPENHAIIEDVMRAVLEQNKKNNPDNYKIQWHTDKHTEDHKAHDHTEGFSCGCGFIMRALDDPEKFGVTPWAMELLVKILEDSTRSSDPSVLGANHKHLESHKERAAVLARGIDSEDSLYQNYFMAKQVDFSPFLSEQELASLDEDEKMELKQMAFTGNFRAFGAKGTQIASMMEKIIRTQDHFLEQIRLTEKQKAWLATQSLYFAPQYDPDVSGTAIRTILLDKLEKSLGLMLTVTKMKLSDNSPLATIDIDHVTGEPIIIDLHLKAEA